MFRELIKKLENKNAVIGVVGLGYVGLPLMIRYSEVGYKVIGFDIDLTKIDLLNSGESYIEHISSKDILLSKEKGFEATVDFSRITEVDAIILCVPTPLNQYREPDLSYVLDTTESCVPHMRKGQIFSLESTTYPGTTEEEMVQNLDFAFNFKS